MRTLELCPFCGSSNTVFIEDFENIGRITCRDCEVVGPVGPYEEVVKRWNNTSIIELVLLLKIAKKEGNLPPYLCKYIDDIILKYGVH